jgi:hypothetical protein
MHPSRSNIGAYVKNVVGIDPLDNSAGTRTGPVIDRLAYQSCSLFGHTGAASGTPSTQSVTYTLQHGAAADGSDMADYASAAAITTDSAGAELDVDLGPCKQYVRVKEVVAFTAGTSPKIEGAATLTFGGGKSLPI